MFALFAQGNNAVQNTVEAVSTSRDALVSAFSQMWEQTALLAPKILAMVVVLVLGYLVARIVARAATVISEKLGLQTAAARSGLADSMQHMGIKRNLPAIVGTIVFWLLMCVFIMAAFNILDMPDVSAAMSGVVSFIPKLLVATIVVVVGLLVASFLRGVVATSADRVGLSYAEHLATAFYYVLVLVTFHAALTHLGMNLQLLENMLLIAFGALAVGFALAFGFGGRDVVGGILAGYYIRQRLQAGDHVTVGTMEGTVRDVGPVATVIETDEDGFINRRSIPNSKMLAEAVR
jgi:small-conductance mechanosensitive channel